MFLADAGFYYWISKNLYHKWKLLIFSMCIGDVLMLGGVTSEIKAWKSQCCCLILIQG